MYFHLPTTYRISLVIFSLNFCFSHSSRDYIIILPTFMKHFRAPNPLPLQYRSSMNERVNLMKECSSHDIRLKWIEPEATKEIFLLILSAENEISSIRKIDIDQQFYFLTSNFSLYEKYNINGQVIVQMLGYFENSTYFPHKDMENNYMKRRNDFHGLELVGLTDESQETDIINLNETMYLPSNDRYDVTNHVQGAYYDIIKSLEAALNFSTRIYYRKAGGWGMPVVHPNGSIEVSDGMVRDINLGKADLIMASISILYNRFLLIGYLHPLAPNKGGIFVKKTSLQEGLDFQVFVRPFRKSTWIVVLISSMVVALCIILVWKILHSDKMNVKEAIKVAAITIQTNFGYGNFDSLPKLGIESPKFIFLIVLLMGNIIWQSYNASLLSGLITPNVIKPFEDLKSLVKSNFRLNTGAKDTSYGSYWSQTQPNSLKEEVYEKNMDESSFHPSYHDAMLQTIRSGKQAYSGSWSQVFSSEPKIACELEMVIFIPMAYHSFGVRKDLPYIPFMNYEISKLRESGMLDVMFERNSYKNPKCLDENDKKSNNHEVSIHKVILPFSIIPIGIFIAFIILSIEQLYITFNMEPKPHNVNILLNLEKKTMRQETVLLMPTSANNCRNKSND